MRTRPLHPLFGVEVLDCDLRAVTADEGYPEIRALFEEHSLLLFRGQKLTDDQHIVLARLFGPIEDRSKGANGPEPRVSHVSNRFDLRPSMKDDAAQLSHLKANQLWHTDSTFLPVPALTNILMAKIVPSIGGETELVSTRVGWADLPAELRDRACDAVIWHRYAHSRAKIDPGLATDELFTMWEDQAWRALWRNPVTGEDALYLASHAYRVEALSDAEGAELIDALIAHATRPEAIYTHAWRPGDVLMWDQRATMHRGRPWPYAEPRTLASICVSATAADGLEDMRPRVH